jgi:hypothetical protein
LPEEEEESNFLSSKQYSLVLGPTSLLLNEYPGIFVRDKTAKA